jgi:chromosome segregation ATPase
MGTAGRMTDLATQRRRSIMDAIRRATDEAERDRLLDELEQTVQHDIEAPISDVQIRVWNFELQMREILRTELGNTNEMIGGLNAGIRALSDMFQSWAERLTDAELTIDNYGKRIGMLEGDISSSKQDRRMIHQEIREVLHQVEQLATVVGGLHDRSTKYDHLYPTEADRDQIATRLLRVIELLPEIEHRLGLGNNDGSAHKP